MSSNSSRRSKEASVPISVVLVAIGSLILVAVFAIWILIPSKMPRPLYAIVGPYLPGGVMPTADAPVSSQRNLLPETPQRLPSVASAAEAPRYRPSPVGLPVRIRIPTLNVDGPITEVSLRAVESDGETHYQWQVPSGYKAGWHENSARLGKPGNTVLNGHHNIYGEIFRDLVTLEEGDQIILHDATQKTFVYEVTETELFEEQGQPLSVRLENAKWIEPTEDERVTLVTCWPYTDNTHRVVIVARPVNRADPEGVSK